MSVVGRSLHEAIDAEERGSRKPFWLADLLGQFAGVGEAVESGDLRRAASFCQRALENVHDAETQGSAWGEEAESLLDVMTATDTDAASLTRLKRSLADLARVYSEARGTISDGDLA